MSNTAEALVALHAAEAELEAALAAEGATSFRPVAPDAAASSTPAGTSGSGVVTYHTADTPFSRGEDVPPSAEDFELPKWAELPNHLGPIAVNGS